MASSDLLSKARQSYEAFNRHDFDAMSGLFSDRFEYKDIAINRSFKGADFKQYCQNLLTAFPDGKIEIKNLIATGDFIATEYVFTGTHKGTVKSKLLDREIQATNKKVQIPVCEVIRVESGKVVSIHAYSDALTMIRQLGLESQLGQLKAA